ncbi:MAG TPA: YtxH domain-containing protein [Geobacteraceae bacterium]|nr:YtxH domain-containing protein [Geobacteraceae bacterium]
MSRRQSNTMTDALMLVGGGIFGAGLALLLAPHSGRQTRKNISCFTRTMGKKTDRVVHDVAGNIADFAGSVRNRAAGFMQTGWKNRQKV